MNACGRRRARELHDYLEAEYSEDGDDGDTETVNGHPESVEWEGSSTSRTAVRKRAIGDGEPSGYGPR